MTAFGAYAAHYDLLYAERDCAGEARFVLDRLRGVVPDLSELLELGCGTGAHAAALAAAGLRVDGIDLSADMLRRAEARRAALPPDLGRRLSFSQGDLVSLDRGRRYDAVVALFHVMSYVTGDAALDRALAGIRRHIRPGGAFLFDFWHGPAIASAGPMLRSKTVEDQRFRLVRATRPVWLKESDQVRVCYRLDVTERATGRQEVIEEEHLLRYFFLDDLTCRLQAAGFRLAESGEWMTGEPAGPDTFGAYCLAVAWDG